MESTNKSMLDMVMSQIGPVSRYLPRGMEICQCEIHGSYLSHYKAKDKACPVCKESVSTGNGSTATQVEHYIDLTHTGPIYGNTSGSGVHGEGK